MTPLHAMPINKAAALHTAGGDATGREELMQAQREAFDQACAEYRSRQKGRRTPATSFYQRDLARHVAKQRRRGLMSKLRPSSDAAQFYLDQRRAYP